MKNNDPDSHGRFSPQIRTFQQIAEYYKPTAGMKRILIVGCGPGQEALYMQSLFNARVEGVDVDQDFDPESAQNVSLQNYDGHTLPFADQSFDVVYSFHVLEHVRDVTRTLDEMERVLEPGGMVYIGVPNRSRLFGYFGMQYKTLGQKVRQNLRDWAARLQGRFRNEQGAHAGFSEKELYQLLSDRFHTVNTVTPLYYRFKRPEYCPLLTMLFTTRLYRLLLPSVYMLAVK